MIGRRRGIHQSRPGHFIPAPTPRPHGAYRYVCSSGSSHITSPRIGTSPRSCLDSKSSGTQGVELRTTHAHKVEVSLSKDEREDCPQAI